MCSNGKRYFPMISIPYSTLEKIPETIEPLKMTETVLEPGKVIKPLISHEEVKLLAERLYGISVLELTELNGYDDKNYKIIEDPNMKNPLITHHSPHGYVLKIMNSMDSQNKGIVEAQNEIMNLLNTRNVTCPKPVRNVYGHFYSVETLSGKQHAVRLLEFVPGALLKDVPRSEALMYQLGEFVANLDNKLQLCGEGKHREETCTNLRSNSMVRVKFPIRTGPAWELRPKPSCSERRPVPSSGTYIGWDDDDDDDECE
ncbi:hypothetical protein MSG28_012565 [Choristoneura fumiferana]|uniref:Uncharacterized protein n=1 Tax=Choristoneura fumiferana TaxID=7141 RepID=A0ACC0JH49_CHOFU|nr:hypothetical protein MSG28_012565 [Choristoneura fumiferana]